MSSYSIQDVCSLIVSKEIPVIFVDTCSILDIVNSLHLNTLSESYAVSALELTRAHGDKVWLVVCETIDEEWSSNIDMVVSTLEKELIKIDRNIFATLTITNELLGSSYSFPQKLSALNINAHIKSLSEAFLKKCLLLKRTDNHVLRGMQRVRKFEAPAQKGKAEPKDCEIIECFLDMCNELRKLNFGQKLLFFTANRSDFGTAKEIKKPLDSQFSAVSAELVNNIEHLMAIVNGKV